MMPLYAKYYITYHLWTRVIDCKSRDTIESFELVLSFFRLYHLQVKLMFTNSKLFMEEEIQWKWPNEVVSTYIFRRYRYMHDT